MRSPPIVNTTNERSSIPLPSEIILARRKLSCRHVAGPDLSSRLCLEAPRCPTVLTTRVRAYHQPRVRRALQDLTEADFKLAAVRDRNDSLRRHAALAVAKPLISARVFERSIDRRRRKCRSIERPTTTHVTKHFFPHRSRTRSAKTSLLADETSRSWVSSAATCATWKLHVLSLLHCHLT